MSSTVLGAPGDISEQNENPCLGVLPCPVSEDSTEAQGGMGQDCGSLPPGSSVHPAQKQQKAKPACLGDF